MANSVHYYREHYEDPTHQHGGAWANLGKSLTDMRFEEELARLAPDKFARALMPEDMRDWLSANVLPSDYGLHMEQQRHNDFSYTRRAWIEFRNTGDAVLFKLTWGNQP